MRRVHFKIDRLSKKIKETVNDMIINRGATLKEVAEYINAQGVITVCVTSVGNYARHILKQRQELIMAQEELRFILDETRRYPELDPAEAIARLAGRNILSALVEAKSKNDWSKLPPEKLAAQASAFIKAAAYKKRTDAQNRTGQEAAAEEYKTILFDALKAEKPELYAQLADYLNQREK